MAKIVLGLGTSHGPLLGTPPEQWDQRVLADKAHPGHPFRGGTYTFDELVKLRASENLAEQSSLPMRKKRFEACQGHIATLAKAFAETKPDVAVIIGNDQMEVFNDINIPTFAVYYGDKIENIPFTEQQKANQAPGMALSERNHHGANLEIYPGLPKLGMHFIKSLMDANFDVASSKELPQTGPEFSGIPHAYGFVYKRIMGEHVVPSVPVFVNTFYPPNQPGAPRCFNMGVELAKAIQAWDEDVRVAVIGSGGLSHFAIDEEFDYAFMDAMRQADAKKLTEFPDHLYRSGTSEMKNWIPLAGVMMHAGLKMDMLEYVPCYRSEAGTGNGMGFARWH